MAYELVEFTGLLEKRISDSIKSVSGHSWNEDHITLKLLDELNSTLSQVDQANTLSTPMVKHHNLV